MSLFFCLLLLSLLSQSHPVSSATIVEICPDADSDPDPSAVLEAAFLKSAGEGFVASDEHCEFKFFYSLRNK
jgi:hypothetical protein